MLGISAESELCFAVWRLALELRTYIGGYVSNTSLALLTLVAILIAPILAVQSQKWIDRHREARNRKIGIFKTLMMYRATPVAPPYVQALNLIDVEFTGERKVRDAWKILLDFLNDGGKQGNKIDADKLRDLTADLLTEMGNSLKYDFDRVQLKKGAYHPIALANIEEEQHAIRRQVLELFGGTRRLPVAMFEQKFPDLLVVDKNNGEPN